MDCDHPRFEGEEPQGSRGDDQALTARKWHSLA